MKLSVIGCGRWGPNFIRIFHRLSGVSLKYACDLNPHRLLHIRGLYPCLITTPDYRQILKDKAVDAVVIATPTNTHYRLAKEFLLSHQHVLVEKPIAMRIKEAEELIDIAKAKNKILMVGHTFLYNPAVNKIKEAIKKNALGKIYYIHSQRVNPGPIRKDVNAIWDLSPHDISIINYILEDLPQEAFAYSQRFLPHRFDDVGFITLRYPDDILTHIHVSWLNPKKVREMTIIGSERMLVYNDTDINQPIKIYDKSAMKKKYERHYYTFEGFQHIARNGKAEVPKVNRQEPLKIECRHFIDCIIHNKQPLSDAQEGLNIVKILEVIDKSIRGQRLFSLHLRTTRK